MEVSIFGKPGCAKCETTKNKLSHFLTRWGITDKVSLKFFDMSTMDGMAEGAYHDVLNIPTVIIHRDDEAVARWDGEVPQSKEVRAHLQETADASAD